MNHLMLISLILIILACGGMALALYWFFSSLDIQTWTPPSKTGKSRRSESDELIEQFLAALEKRKEKPGNDRIVSKDTDDPADHTP